MDLSTIKKNIESGVGIKTRLFLISAVDILYVHRMLFNLISRSFEQRAVFNET
jgi:hypothetical protein